MAARRPEHRRLVDALNDLYERLDETRSAAVARETWATGGAFAIDVSQELFFKDFPEWDQPEVRRAYGDLSEELRLDLGEGASAALACALGALDQVKPAETDTPLAVMRGPVCARLRRDQAWRETLTGWLNRLVNNEGLHQLLNSGQTTMVDAGVPRRQMGARDVSRALRDLERHAYTPLATFVAANAYILYLTWSAPSDQIRSADGFSRAERRLAVSIGCTPLLGAMNFNRSSDPLTYPALALSHSDPLPSSSREITDAIDLFAKRALARIPDREVAPIVGSRSFESSPKLSLPPVSQRRREESEIPSRPKLGATYAVGTGLQFSFEIPALKWIERHPAHARAMLVRLESSLNRDLATLPKHSSPSGRDLRELKLDSRTSILLGERGDHWEVCDVTSPEFVRVRLRNL